ncbi:chloride channel protein [Proteinivorax tanatarense]|uniref:Chloride channel protein n=1 Tax=Proteinivorax tanatarense TaxID=1260629 RepID=A0AAU7VIM9_9FIRM
MPKKFQFISGYMVKWLTIATLMGVGGGLSAYVLRSSIDLMESVGGVFPIWLAPIFGGCLLSLIYLWDDEAAGFGTDKYLLAVNKRKEYQFKTKTLFSKVLATATTLGFQGSGGVEGPMLVIGGCLDNLVRKIPILKKHLTKDDHRKLTICGAAGAVGAIFRSPLGGGIFVVEILYKSSLPYYDLFPAILSSTFGFVIFAMVKSGEPLFLIPDFLPSVENVPFFVLVGFLSGIASLIFMKIFSITGKVFQNLPMPKLHPILGGIMTGLVIFFVSEAAGTGTSIIQYLIDYKVSITALILILFAKMLATSFTVSSGGSGGLVIPALFIGAVCGNIVSGFVAVGDPGLSASLVIAGMAASLSGIANVPIAAAIMLVEMVGLQLGVPATIGSVMGYAVAQSSVIYNISSREGAEFKKNKAIRKSDRNLQEH